MEYRNQNKRSMPGSGSDVRDELLHNIPDVRFFISTITARRRILRDICDDSAFLKLYFEEFIKKSSSFIVNFTKNRSFKTPAVSALSDIEPSSYTLSCFISDNARTVRVLNSIVYKSSPIARHVKYFT
jgi:hypothetical protein